MTSFRNRAFAVVGALAAAGALTAVAAPSASADDLAHCPSKSFCLFENANFGGGRIVFPAPGTNGFPSSGYEFCHFKTDGLTYNNGHSVDNSASSMVNNSTRTVLLWRNDGCSGNVYSAVPRSEDSTFSNNKITGPGSFNDRATGITVEQ